MNKAAAAAAAAEAVEFSIIEKIMAVRIGKRPKEKDPVEQVVEVVPTKVVSANLEWILFSSSECISKVMM